MKNRNLKNNDDWATPRDFLEKEIIPIFENNKGKHYFDPCPLNPEFDGFFINPPYRRKLKESKGKHYFDPCPLNPEFDGLNIKWALQNFINPPYSRKLKESFIKKAFEESKKGKLCVMLLPVSTSTKIFHEIIYPNAEIRFIKGRIKFLGTNTKGEYVKNKCGMHDSMIVIFR